MEGPAKTRRSLRPRREDLVAASLVLLLFAGVVMIGGLFLIETQFRPEGSAFGLPTRIPTCGRSFIRDAADVRVFTRAEIEAQMTPGYSPTVLEPAIGEIPLLAPFEPHCDVLIFLHVGPDAYVGYELQGGP